MKVKILLLLLIIGQFLTAQSYTSYFTGNTTNITTNPQGGSCLMGGATENDQAMQWFLNRADGGDVLVLRASGSDGYNDYMFSDLGVSLNSVETIVFNSAEASSESYIIQKIDQAEAIWFAGGDQWDYVSYWRNTGIVEAVRQAIQNRNVVVGGTSAGMAILGGHYFTAENGTVTSTEALNNPYDDTITIDDDQFIDANYLSDMVTDTHYDNPDRKGRHSVFLARILTDTGIQAKGIACEEYTAVCIDENGLARIFGEFPDFDDYAYFIQPNCAVANNTPETISPNTPLTWNQNGEALTVYKVGGTTSGDHTFDLVDWQTASGGDWEYWSIDNGNLSTVSGQAPDCTLSVEDFTTSDLNIYPIPADGILNLKHFHSIQDIKLYDLKGCLLASETDIGKNDFTLNIQSYPKGIYVLKVTSESQTTAKKFLKK